MLQQRREHYGKVDSEQDIDSHSDDPLTMARSQARLATHADTMHSQPAAMEEQSESEIAQIRHGYSALMRTLREERRALVAPENTKLQDMIEEANELYHHVQRTVDATLDARFMAATADLGVEKVQHLPLSANPFTVADFVHLLGRLERTSGSSGEGLERIGRIAGRHWRGVVGVESMIGLSEENIVDSVKTVKRRRRQETVDVAPITKPTVMTAQELQRQQQAKETTDLVIEVYEQLEVLFQKHIELPLLKVICDPTSFGRSVELLFYVSFLVADGRLGVSVDDANQQIMLTFNESLGSDQDDHSNAVTVKKHHQIVTLSESLWRATCQSYNLSEPLIKL